MHLYLSSMYLYWYLEYSVLLVLVLGDKVLARTQVSTHLVCVCRDQGSVIILCRHQALHYCNQTPECVLFTEEQQQYCHQAIHALHTSCKPYGVWQAVFHVHLGWPAVLKSDQRTFRNCLNVHFKQRIFGSLIKVNSKDQSGETTSTLCEHDSILHATMHCV